ncbi:hypothetical protein EPA93_34595 [Ktedonosporobacter rubrisoli]|uniref:Uncharacterized protein n=1 Tax=Ktedonosporobacter rubrisoli TaxID=2509675 RepID=A0A4P6JZA3_KTERU|nr:hypothetical protein [Ktedonosporobacter rubrisoli]QBD80823.1 hypothetical protein EPA93_34595 [Ktedonosporobacter rubrisoli]
MKKHRVRGKGVRIKRKLPCLTFTIDQLLVLKSGLALFEQIAQAQNKPLPNLDIALITVKGVKTKIQRMLTLNGWRETTTFDANEITVLKSSVWMLLISLETMEQSPETQRQQQICEQLKALLSSSADLQQRYH